MNDDFAELKQHIEDISSLSAGEVAPEIARQAFEELIDALNTGSARAALRDDDGVWIAQTWIKKGILLGFRIGSLVDFSSERFPYFDKDTYPLKPLHHSHKVRIVPGGSSIRTGSFVAPGVVCMPPMYVNVGAYVDEGSLIDSHALVGSCAQIGKRVHLSAAVQIGGVLEPVGALPVIVEDDVFLGGGSGVYEGCIVRRGAVLAPGVVLTRSTTLYDLVQERTIQASGNEVLEVPENAVIVPGSRRSRGGFAEEHGVSLYAPIIVKYRDGKTDAATTLETALR